jgi:hypothetical protein
VTWIHIPSYLHPTNLSIYIHHQYQSILFKLSNTLTVSRLQNRKLQKQFRLHLKNFIKIHGLAVVPVATLYLHIAPIEGVGEQTLEIGDLGGDLGDFEIVNEDVRMCGGGHM